MYGTKIQLDVGDNTTAQLIAQSHNRAITPYESTELAYNTANKYHGDLLDVRDEIIMKTDVETPFLRMALASNRGRQVDGHEYQVQAKTLSMGDPSILKMNETGNANSIGRDITKYTNNVMRIGVAVSATLESMRVAKIPNREQLMDSLIQDGIDIYNFVKEHYCLFGDRTNANETDGILTAFAKAYTANNDDVAYYKDYSADPNTSLKKTDLDAALVQMKRNRASFNSVVIFACTFAVATMASWFEGKVVLQTKSIFTIDDLTVYPSAHGNIPIVSWNSEVEFGANTLEDKVLIVDMRQIGIANLIFPMSKDMPPTAPLEILRREYVESFGLDYGDTKKMALFEGIGEI